MIITLDQHREFGSRLKTIHREATQAVAHIDQQSPMTAAVADKLVEIIEQLRCRLDDKLCRDHPADASVKIYRDTTQ